MAHADNVHLLELFMFQSDQGFPNNLVLWMAVVSCAGYGREVRSAYP